MLVVDIDYVSILHVRACVLGSLSIKYGGQEDLFLSLPSILIQQKKKNNRSKRQTLSLWKHAININLRAGKTLNINYYIVVRYLKAMSKILKVGGFHMHFQRESSLNSLTPLHCTFITSSILLETVGTKCYGDLVNKLDWGKKIKSVNYDHATAIAQKKLLPFMTRKVTYCKSNERQFYAYYYYYFYSADMAPSDFHCNIHSLSLAIGEQRIRRKFQI